MRAATLHAVRIDITLRGSDGAERDAALTAAAGACFGDVEPGLRALAGEAPGTSWWAGGLRLAASAALGTSGLVPGAVISAGPPASVDASGAVTRLAVIGGPDAGRLVILPRGGLTVGRAPDCDLVLSDPDVSRRHVAIRASSAGVRVRDLGSTNGTSIDGRPVGGQEAEMSRGQLLRIGQSMLTVDDVEQQPATVRAGAAGALLLSRPPRWSPAAAARLVELPVPPAPGVRPRMQWITALVPAAAGVVLAFAMHSLQFLVFLLLSPLVILASALGDRIHWRRSRRRDAVRHSRRASAARAEVAAALRDEAAERRRAAPDPVALLRVATARGGRLWERRRGDPDALTVRVGLADLPSWAKAHTGSETAPAGTVPAVPVCLDLRAGAIGIAAPSAVGRGIARWLVGQLAVLHTPADLEFAAILSVSAARDWAWLRWLPHLRGRIATSAAGHARLLAELSELAEQRLSRRGGGDAWGGPWLVLVIEGRSESARSPALAELLATGTHAGITAICLDRRAEQLPSGCVTTALATGETGALLRIRAAGRIERAEPVADRVSHAWADELARSLAPLVDAAAADSALPEECRLVDLLPELADAGALRRSWCAAPPTPATVIGLGEGGPIVVDLARDGPHLLVAGTTGAGKSELLQTLVAGLAAGQPPSALTFLLVDYKGGAAFAECARLPHVAGVVTDLDGHLTSRALRSLECELRRREELLAAAGASDIDAYRSGAAHREPLPRLVIVVDEFAALSQELPQFVTGLVGVAQRGRSLGVHLVLATQRPAGAVSPEIRANTTLRIALRVADPVESLDVIGTDAAALIDRRLPGRAVLSAGGVVTHLQVARVGAPSPGGPASSPPAVIPLDSWRRPRPVESASPPGSTDLRAIVTAACAAAAAGGWAPARRPWLPPLPALLPADLLPRPTAEAAVHIGLADDPHAQAQPPVRVDLAAGGCLLFTGAARSGRTSALLSLAAQAAAALGPHRLEIHAVDCAGGALAALEPLPHCGTVARGEQFEVVAALLRHLGAKVDADRSAPAGSAGEPPSDLRRVLLLLDGWESFCAGADEHDTGRSVDTLLGILRAAESAGATVAIAGDRSTLAPRLTGAIPTRFVLRLADRADYGLAGIPAHALPDVIPSGRAVRATDAAEVQLCFLGAEPTAVAREAALAELAARSRSASTKASAVPRPVRMRPLPQYVGLSSLPRRAGRFRLGRGGDTAEPVLVDLFAGAGRLLIAGPPRSGRSTVLRTLLAEAAAAAVAVLVAAPRRSPVAAAAADYGARLITPDDPLGGWRPPSAGERTLLLVDDSELFLDTGAGETLTTLVRHGGAALAAATAGRSDELPLTYRGVAAEIRRSRCALLLQPAPVDGELVGLRLPRHRTRLLPGRGLLVGDPEWAEPCPDGALPIQVAAPDTDTAARWAPDQPMCG